MDKRAIYKISLTCPMCGALFIRDGCSVGAKNYCSRTCFGLGRRNIFTKSLIEENSIPEPNSGCWLWLGALTGSGYGIISAGKVSSSAHRLSYILFNGTIPSGLFVRHSCDNPSCVNPEHLEVGTHDDNAKDAVRRDRVSHGSKRWSAILTEKQIPDIRLRLSGGQTTVHIAELYSVDRSTISMIKRGRTWRRA